jgi:hypothetical protein
MTATTQLTRSRAVQRLCSGISVDDYDLDLRASSDTTPAPARTATTCS